MGVQITLPSQRRRFAQTEAYPHIHFFIEPKLLEVFGKRLLQRQSCLLVGHRQSGKTTICQALTRWFATHPEKFTELAGGNLSDFDIHIATFDAQVTADKGPKVFWEAVLGRLYRLDKNRVDNRLPPSAGAFLNFFSKRNHPSSKPVILIIDEASRLTSVGGTISQEAKEVTDQFISALRSLKNAHDYSLHAFALVGTASLRELLIAHNQPGASSQISPFTEEASWDAGRFTKAEVKDLFDQFAIDINRKFESADISADIFDLTLGHKGLVGACGAFIQSGYDITSPIVTLDDWKEKTTIELQRYILANEHYSSIIRSLKHLTPECRSILAAVLRYGTYEVNLTRVSTKYLLAEGMVSVKEEKVDRNAIIECSAPILRALMLTSITLPKVSLSQTVPDEKKLDPQWLLAQTIENMYLQHLYSPQVLNADENPLEYAFQSEFATIIKNLVPLAYPLSQYKTLVEVKERDEVGNRRQRLDILIRNGSSLPSYGFELVVAARTTIFDEHCKRAEEYGKLHGCQMFMVNLCPKVTLHGYFGMRPYNLTPVNVVINPEERKGIIKYKKDGEPEKWNDILIYETNDQPVSINGSDWDMLFNSEG